MNSLMRFIDQVSLEGIDHQNHSRLGSGIEQLLLKLRSFNRISQTTLSESGLSEFINSCTGLNITFNIEPGIDAFVYVPDIDRNNIILQEAHQVWLENADSELLFKNSKFFTGTVDLVNGKVGGSFSSSRVETRLHLGENFLFKASTNTIAEVTAIILHELGHVFAYFEMLARATKTSYLLAEGSKRLRNANSKEIRLKVFKQVEDELRQEIPDKEKYSQVTKTTEEYQTIFISTEITAAKSQLGYNPYDVRGFEQLADNFAARMGYAKELAMGLDTLHRSFIYDRVYLNPAVNMIWNVVKFLHFIGSILLSLYTIATMNVIVMFATAIINPAHMILVMMPLVMLLTLGNPMASVYDPLDKRIKMIRNQISDALKDKTLSSNYQRKLVNDALVIDKILETMSDNPGVWDIIFTNFFPNGRNQKSLADMQEDLEDMFNNKLFTTTAALTVAHS